jgi:hypothetical protein
VRLHPHTRGCHRPLIGPPTRCADRDVFSTAPGELTGDAWATTLVNVNQARAIHVPRVPRAIAILVLAILGIAAAVWLLQPRPPDATALGCLPADVTSGSVPVRSTGDGQTVSLTGDWAEDVELGGGAWTGELRDVEVNRGRAVAVGNTGGPSSQGLVAVSDDGRLWSRPPSDAPAFDRADIVDIASVELGFIAVGSRSVDDAGHSEGMAWVSSDGSSWAAGPQPTVAYIHRVAARVDELLALGSTESGEPMLGRSSDGLTWEWEPWPTRGAQADIASTADGWIAGGSIGNRADDGVPVVWRSPDGLHWTCQVLGTPPATPFGSVVHVLPGASTTMAMGGVGAHCGGAGSCAGHSAAWTAAAGGAWVPVPEGVVVYSRAAVTPTGGFLAVSSSGLVASEDGAGWRFLAAMPDDAGAMALALAPFGLVAVGQTYRTGTGQPWVGLLPAESP